MKKAPTKCLEEVRWENKQEDGLKGSSCLVKVNHMFNEIIFELFSFFP